MIMIKKLRFAGIIAILQVTSTLAQTPCPDPPFGIRQCEIKQYQAGDFAEISAPPENGVCPVGFDFCYGFLGNDPCPSSTGVCIPDDPTQTFQAANDTPCNTAGGCLAIATTGVACPGVNAFCETKQFVAGDSILELEISNSSPTTPTNGVCPFGFNFCYGFGALEDGGPDAPCPSNTGVCIPDDGTTLLPATDAPCNTSSGCYACQSCVTDAPTSSPTSAPSNAPSTNPTSAPSKAPSSSPTSAPSSTPTSNPTSAPSSTPTSNPTSTPSKAPSSSPVFVCNGQCYKYDSGTRVLTIDTPSNNVCESDAFCVEKLVTATPSTSPTQSPTQGPTRQSKSGKSTSITAKASKSVKDLSKGGLCEDLEVVLSTHCSPGTSSMSY